MRTSTAVFTSVLLALSGCSGEDVVPSAPLADEAPFSPLPERQTTVSGIVHDPEAFFFSLAMFPPDPEDPEGENAPPPALFEGIPFLTLSVAVGSSVSLVADGARAGSSQAPSTPTGFWQVQGVPSSDTLHYLARAEPPAQGPVLTGGVDIFPSPPFETVPEGQYFPTTALRPIIASPAMCQGQVAALVGETGALGALAQLLSAQGTPTTAADLADPAKTGGVVLVWVYAPSFALDLFNIPSGGIVAEASRGTVYGIDWAPPGAVPEGQSPMGYLAAPEPTSSLGYFAVVLPPGGGSAPVTLTFKDTLVTGPQEEPGPFGPRPWRVPAITVPGVPGISFLRHFALRAEDEPVDPDADPVPPDDLSWRCIGQ
jgi:hypothetical protein